MHLEFFLYVAKLLIELYQLRALHRSVVAITGWMDDASQLATLHKYPLIQVLVQFGQCLLQFHAVLVDERLLPAQCLELFLARSQFLRLASGARSLLLDALGKRTQVALNVKEAPEHVSDYQVGLRGL